MSIARGERNREVAATVALIVLLVLGLASRLSLPLAAFTRHISYNNNEGWGAYWSARALSGAPLYTDAASPLTNNYTPLSFYITGLLGRLTGDTILAGRILCFGGLLACACLIGVVVGRFGRERRSSVAAAAAFLLIAATVGPRYVAQNDPQWFAAAVQCVALLLLIPFRPAVPGRGRVVAACLILLLAGLIKHNQVALPIAVTIALAWHDRRALALWIAVGAAALTVTLLALHALYGAPFFDQVLHHQRTLARHHFVPALVSTAFCLPAMIVAALRWKAAQAAAPRDFRRTLLLLFALFATVLGIGERLGAGVSQNAHFDAIIALVTLAGALVMVPGGRFGSPAAKLAMTIAIVLPAAAKAIIGIPHRVREIAALPATDAAWQRAIAFIAAQPGPALCERPALCYWAGKSYQLDFFNYGQKLRLTGDPWHLRERIDHQAFGAIEIARDKKFRHHNARLTWPYYALIDARYHDVQVLPEELYVLAPDR